MVNRISLRVLGVNAGRTSFQRWSAVTAVEQIVRAEVNVVRRKRAEFTEQFPPVRLGGVIRFVGAEEPPDRFQITRRLADMNLNCDPKSVIHCRGAAGAEKRTAAARNNDMRMGGFENRPGTTGFPRKSGRAPFAFHGALCNPAIHADVLAGDPNGRLAGQKRNHFGNFRRLAEPAKGGHLCELPDLVRCFAVGKQLCFRRAR